jgi:hypothetical protein
METKKTYGFDNMSKDPRTWIFQSATLLSDTQKNIVATELDQFLQKWAAHGTELFAAFEIRYNRFIIIALDEDHSSASGCSIDSMMRLIQKLDDEFSLKLLDRTRVTYKVGDEIRECDANTYRSCLITLPKASVKWKEVGKGRHARAGTLIWLLRKVFLVSSSSQFLSFILMGFPLDFRSIPLVSV